LCLLFVVRVQASAKLISSLWWNIHGMIYKLSAAVL
jgi:hypothetical protein